MRSQRHGFRTRAIHAGEAPDPATGASSPNIVMSTTFVASPDAGFSVESREDDAPFHLTPDQEISYRAFAGEGIFRLSVGLEDPRDLREDLDAALRSLSI